MTIVSTALDDPANDGQRGFSLVELLVVIIILGLLAGLAWWDRGCSVG